MRSIVEAVVASTALQVVTRKFVAKVEQKMRLLNRKMKMKMSCSKMVKTMMLKMSRLLPVLLMKEKN